MKNTNNSNRIIRLLPNKKKRERERERENKKSVQIQIRFSQMFDSRNRNTANVVAAVMINEIVANNKNKDQIDY